jgi:hypothetical protein
MAAGVTIGAPYGDHVGIFGSQRDAPRQRVKITIAGGQVANQNGAPTTTALLPGSCIGIITATVSMRRNPNGDEEEVLSRSLAARALTSFMTTKFSFVKTKK